MQKVTSSRMCPVGCMRGLEALLRACLVEMTEEGVLMCRGALLMEEELEDDVEVGCAVGEDVDGQQFEQPFRGDVESQYGAVDVVVGGPRWRLGSSGLGYRGGWIGREPESRGLGEI